MSLGTLVDRGAEAAAKASKKTLDTSARALVWSVRKTWRPVARVMLGVYLFCLYMHYSARPWVELEDTYTARKNAMLAELATSYGFEPSQAAEVLSHPVNYASVCELAALREGFSESYGRKVCQHESGFNPLAKSPKGALGLMQVMPANAKIVGMTERELLDPEKNARAGFRLLRMAYNRYHDARKALLAYNGGDEAVRVVTKCGDNTVCMGGYVESYAYSRDILNDVASDMRG